MTSNEVQRYILNSSLDLGQINNTKWEINSISSYITSFQQQGDITELGRLDLGHSSAFILRFH